MGDKFIVFRKRRDESLISIHVFLVDGSKKRKGAKNTNHGGVNKATKGYCHAKRGKYDKKRCRKTTAPTMTMVPTKTQTDSPTQPPTDPTTESPTDQPTESPTDSPTESPTDSPTESPTDQPTESPTDQPTESPTDSPTKSQTDSPTESLTDPPTESPTDSPILRNVARDGTASQSSDKFSFSKASKAINGNTSGYFSTQQCSHTEYQHQPWWKVDLHFFYSINTIVIWNRIDCCMDRLDNAEIKIYIDDILVDTKNLGVMGDTRKKEFSYSGIIGNIVKVQLPGENYLNLAEVQVFGSLQ